MLGLMRQDIEALSAILARLSCYSVLVGDQYTYKLKT